MESGSKRKSKSYITEIIIVLAVLIAGTVLQLVAGPFDVTIVASPVNLIFLLIVIVLAFIKTTSLIGRFGTLSLSIILISVLTLLSILIGLIPGNSIKSSWPFVLTYLMLMCNLALVIGRRVRAVKLKDFGFILNHIGLFVLFFAAGFGSADSEKFFMKVYEGKVEWRGESSSSGKTIDLPLAIQLKDFKMEEYPSKLAVVDKNSGNVLPVAKPQFMEGELNSESVMEGWILLIDSIGENGINDSPAVYILAKNKQTGAERSGWVSCGNKSQPFKVLDLTEEICVAMMNPEPKSFSSEIEVNTEGGGTKTGIVQVNHPLTVGYWNIYQYSYDTETGKGSAFSVFELVYDPWLVPAYIGIFMLFLGSMTLFWKGGKK